MPVKLIEREISKEELDHIHKGFEALDRESGVEPGMEKRFTVVCENNGSFLGCASGLKYHKWFYLTDMWMEDQYCGLGHGSEMLKRLEQIIAKAGAENIYAWTRGYEAPEFYRKMGYEEFAGFVDYYADGQGRFGFRKSLD